jgi:hypothetical protein
MIIAAGLSRPLDKDLFVHGRKLSSEEEKLAQSLIDAFRDPLCEASSINSLMEEGTCFLEGSGLVQMDLFSVSRFYLILSK